MTAVPQAVKSTLLPFLLLTLMWLACLAALGEDAGARHPVSASAKASGVKHPQPNNDAIVAPMKIFSNLGQGSDLYDASNGYFVMGRDNGNFSYSQDIAIPFVPATNATVTRVKAALQYYDFGGGQPNSAVLAIYTDRNGLPGKRLAKKLIGKFDDFGSGCCELALWTLSTPLPLTAGTQYWVVGTTGSQFTDTVSVWNWTFEDQPANFAFQQDDGGWLYLSERYGYAASAVAVRGTVP